MVKYREILRLHAVGISMRNIAYSCGCSKTTVKNVVDRAKARGLESVGSGYLPPHRAGLVGMSAEVRYAAGVDKGMIPMQG